MSHYATLRTSEIMALYRAADRRERPDEDVLRALGPLGGTFDEFLSAHRDLRPLADERAISLLEQCATPGFSEDDVLDKLRELAPGGGQIGWRQINTLNDHWRDKAWAQLGKRWGHWTLEEHDSAFGSGGDIVKTGHATTAASIVVAPARTICKTGTGNVTSEHGSVHAISAFGYTPRQPELDLLNRELRDAGFAFVAFADLGLPYTKEMVAARHRLWTNGLRDAGLDPSRPTGDWHRRVSEARMPVDVYKIVGANTLPLNPANHSTGVCHPRLLPYVLGIYLHRGAQGMIVFGYDGIDELSTASSDPTRGAANNVVVQIREDDVIIAEVAPEDLGLPRARLDEITQTGLRSEAAQFMDVLEGRGHGPRRDFIVANAAVLLVAGGVVGTGGGLLKDLRAGVEEADHLITSGRSRDGFERLRRASVPATLPATSPAPLSAALSATLPIRVLDATAQAAGGKVPVGAA